MASDKSIDHMSDQQEPPASQPTVPSRLVSGGLALMVLGLLLQCTALFDDEIRRLHDPPIVCSLADRTEPLRSGIVFAGFGAALYAKGIWRTTGMALVWGGVGLVPFLGPIFALTYHNLFRRLSLIGAFATSLGVALVSVFVLFYVFFFFVAKHHHSVREFVQKQAQTTLGGIYVFESAFYSAHGRFGTFDEIGFTAHDKRNYYTFRIDASGRPGTIIPIRNGQVTPDNTIVPANLSPTSFTATATGNIDCDTTLDQWHVNDQKQGLDKADVDDDKN